jgi:hypothetical protein
MPICAEIGVQSVVNGKAQFRFACMVPFGSHVEIGPGSFQIADALFEVEIAPKEQPSCSSLSEFLMTAVQIGKRSEFSGDLAGERERSVHVTY